MNDDLNSQDTRRLPMLILGGFVIGIALTAVLLSKAGWFPKKKKGCEMPRKTKLVNAEKIVASEIVVEGGNGRSVRIAATPTGVGFWLTGPDGSTKQTMALYGMDRQTAFGFYAADNPAACVLAFSVGDDGVPFIQVGSKEGRDARQVKLTDLVALLGSPVVASAPVPEATPSTPDAANA